MAQNQGIMLAQPQPLLPAPETFRTMLEMAKALHQSGLLPQTVGTPQAAFAIMQKGVEIGVPPMAAFAGITVIKGKPTAGAELMLALIYRDHGDDAIRFTVATGECATIHYKRRSWAKPEAFSFTMEDARAAGLAGGDTWRKFPAAMLRARAISAVARMAFPDSIGGLYTAEELGASVDVQDGEVVVLDTPPERTTNRETGEIATAAAPGQIGGGTNGQAPRPVTPEHRALHDVLLALEASTGATAQDRSAQFIVAEQWEARCDELLDHLLDVHRGDAGTKAGAAEADHLREGMAWLRGRGVQLRPRKGLSGDQVAWLDGVIDEARATATPALREGSDLAEMPI